MRSSFPSVDVTANSIGALWSVAFAINAPDRVSHLALVGAPSGHTRRPRRLMLPLGLPLVGQCSAGTSSRMGRGRKPEVVGPGHRQASRKSRRPVLDYDVANMRRNVESMVSLSRVSPSARPGVPTGAGPRRALASVDDADAPRRGRTRRLRIAGEGSGSRREESEPSPRSDPGAGHNSWIDDPESVVAEIERFMANARSHPSGQRPVCKDRARECGRSSRPATTGR